MTDTAALGERLERAAQDLAGVEVATHDDAAVEEMLQRPPDQERERRGELVIVPQVARAATRTPDTSSSPRGDAWVRFAPATLDGHAVDRLEAWFALAYRRATEASATPRSN